MFNSKQKITLLTLLALTFILFLTAAFVKPVSAATENTGLARVSWVAPTTDAGSTAPLTDLAGFMVYYGTASETLNSCPTLTYHTAAPFTSYADVTSPTATSIVISSLGVGSTYYFTVAAYDSSHNVSSCATVTGTGKTEVSHLATYRGDLNGDLKVDIQDYNIMITNFGQSACGNPADADKNCSGAVGIFDYNYVISDFGKNANPS